MADPFKVRTYAMKLIFLDRTHVPILLQGARAPVFVDTRMRYICARAHVFTGGGGGTHANDNFNPRPKLSFLPHGG